MPKRKTETITCRFFKWRLFDRAGVYYADGRSASSNLGKHSLGTRNRDEAVKNLAELDYQKAVEVGLTQPQIKLSGEEIPIEAGWDDFMNYCARPEVLGGTSPPTQKRYRPVRTKHVEFCRERSIRTWNQVDRRTTEEYGQWLSKKKYKRGSRTRTYAARTICLELELISSVVKWLVLENRLPAAAKFTLCLRRPDGSDTYCFRPEEVCAMIEHCRNTPDLGWVADVIVALACSGLRISEVASLRFSDIDLTKGVIRLTDERGSVRKREMGAVRTLKGRRGRILPITAALHEVLAGLPRHPDGRLFHGPRGGKLKPDTFRRTLIGDVLEPLKERFPTTPGEIGFEHGRPHSFRHFFVSRAFLSGRSEGEIRQWVGHRESRTVELYRHLGDEDSLRRINQIDFFGRNGDSEGPSR